MSEHGKRVSWVELYLDLVFVLAIGQVASVIVDQPEKRSVWIALGLFATVWWTWVGFAVLYNRRGTDEPSQRILFLAGSVPAGVAAVAIGPAATGDSTVLGLSLAAIRLLLAVANGADGAVSALWRRRITRACLLSAGLFAVSAATPPPLRYVLWGLALAGESGAMLQEDRQAARRARRERSLTVLAPADPSEALDAHHFAERFGLFVIILLGEVVVEAGQASVDGHVATAAAWAALCAAMVLAAGLWWLYFDAASEINLRVLTMSGGSPTVARAIFAVGHMFPAFALLLTAAGVGLLLEEDPPAIAYWLTCVGIGIYVAGTRAFLRSGRRKPSAGRAAFLIATFLLGRLSTVLSPHAYLWLLTGWVLLSAVLATRSAPGEKEAVAERPPEYARSP